MFQKIVEKFSEYKDIIFLLMCLVVHTFNSILFFRIGITPLGILNLVSSIFYAGVILFFKDKNYFLLVFAYFEIILFALMSELICGGSFNYIYFVIGMIAVIFFLLPSKSKQKYLCQCFGMFVALCIYQISVKKFMLFPEYSDLINSYQTSIGYMNLAVTLGTLFFISTFYGIQLNHTQDKLDYSSNHDMLTGLYNRRFFESIMKRNKDENENAFSIAMFDVDDFKKVNDTYGHDAGDLILETLSQTISQNAAENNIVIRWGGEEFILYMPNTNNEAALRQLERIQEAIRNISVQYKKYTLTITATIGLCTENDITEYENTIKIADEKLYYGKKHGKNCIVNEIQEN